MNLVNAQIRNARLQVHGQIRNKIQRQIHTQVRVQVWNQVWNQIYNQIEDQIYNQIGNQIRSQAWDQLLEIASLMKLVNDQVQTHQIRDQVRSQVWNQAQCRGYNPVWAQAWRQIREPINNQLIPLSAQLRIPA